MPLNTQIIRNGALSGKQMKWNRVSAGIYQTADSRLRVMNLAQTTGGRPAWQLLTADGRDGWEWCNTYQNKRDAQDAAREI